MDVLIQLEWLSPSSLHLQPLLHLRYSCFSLPHLYPSRSLQRLRQESLRLSSNPLLPSPAQSLPLSISVPFSFTHVTLSQNGPPHHHHPLCRPPYSCIHLANLSNPFHSFTHKLARSSFKPLQSTPFFYDFTSIFICYLNFPNFQTFLFHDFLPSVVQFFPTYKIVWS